MLHKLFSLIGILLKFSLICAVLAILPLIVLLEHISSQFEGNAELPADCAVVFGAAVHKESKSGPGIDRRVSTAAGLYMEGNVDTLFMTGGKGSDDLDSEAEVMERTALKYGVNAKDIILEENATSTWENLQLVRPLTEEHDCNSVVAISDAYHLARIQYLAKQQDWEDLRTLPAANRPDRKFELRAAVREAFGLTYYFLNQYIPVDRFI